MLLVCGRATPSPGVIGGTNSCANADGRAVTTDVRGAFAKKLPVAEPLVPCPCVVDVAMVTGSPARADAVLDVAGHPVAPLPAEPSGGRLSILSDTRLIGSGSLLTWFGAPPSRTLVFTAGNLGTAPVKDPVLQLGTARGVFAPQWDDQQWHGTLAPGRKARIEPPVELSVPGAWPSSGSCSAWSYRPRRSAPGRRWWTGYGHAARPPPAARAPHDDSPTSRTTPTRKGPT